MAFDLTCFDLFLDNHDMLFLNTFLDKIIKYLFNVKAL